MQSALLAIRALETAGVEVQSGSTEKGRQWEQALSLLAEMRVELRCGDQRLREGLTVGSAQAVQ